MWSFSILFTGEGSGDGDDDDAYLAFIKRTKWTIRIQRGRRKSKKV